MESRKPYFSWGFEALDHENVIFLVFFLVFCRFLGRGTVRYATTELPSAERVRERPNPVWETTCSPTGEKETLNYMLRGKKKTSEIEFAITRALPTVAFDRHGSSVSMDEPSSSQMASPQSWRCATKCRASSSVRWTWFLKPARWTTTQRTVMRR